jgi:hypothetical protein
MSEVKVPSDKIPKVVQDLGFVTGLLVQRNQDLFFDLAWFERALDEIKAVPSRRKELMQLLRDLLGTRDPNAPANRAWYALPYSGETTGVYVVLPPDDSQPNADIGIGILKNFTQGPVSVQAYLYVPLFSIPIGGSVVVTGSPGHPIETFLSIKGSDTGLEFKGEIYFSGAAPKFTLTFSNGQTARTLDELRSTIVRDSINTILANASVVKWLEQKLGQSPFTVGGVLVATGILTRTGTTYTFGSLDALVGKTASQIAALLFAEALRAMAANEKPIVAFGTGGIWIYGTPDGTNTSYGLRLQVPDVRLGKSSFTLQVGKYLSSDEDDSNWISRSDPNASFAKPGVSLTLVSIDAAKTPSFKPKAELISIGFDAAGSAGKPLIDVKGVTLDRVEPRFMIALDFANLSKTPWGVAARFEKLGLPLGNSVSGASASNPVAQNLLSSGGSSGDTEAVNPAFSASISRVFDPAQSAAINVVLEQPNGGSADTVWLPVQRAFGPLQCDRIGVQWPSPNQNLQLTFLFDGNVHLGALEIDLIGLSLGLPLRTPGNIGNYSLDLQGLAVSYVSGPLTVTGGFVKNNSATPVSYDGQALIQAANWSIAALGSYASIDGEPSLFIFARLGAALGGPPFFFVTGICAGFGYNRSLRMPKMDEVPSFPLLSGISDSSKIGGDNPTPAKALQALSKWVKPAQGVNWFAAGVQFTSFELVKSNAVLVVLPTGDFQAAIFGVSRMKLGQEGPQFAYAELGISVVLRPSDGFFGATAVLSPNSYILTKECHLTGGFAFYLWFDGEHAGDFVLTLGGYHPAFKKPAWYPDVPRLGFSWNVSSSITIRGAAYFALTPSCVMGGGSLDVEFHSGDLRAWFTAHADFLFNWKPFYYLGSVGVSIGASYKLDLLFTSTTISVELGADLEIWGPPTGGKVHIDWYIISFTVSFGADRQQSAGYLGWNDFKTLLPQNDTSSKRFFKGESNDDPPLTNVISIAIRDGLTSKDHDRWLVRADALEFSVATAWPLTEADLTGATTTRITPQQPDYFVAVRGMGIRSLKSVLTITVRGSSGNQDLGAGWVWSATSSDVPEAMWGLPLAEGDTPTAPTANVLKDRLVGVGGFTPVVAKPKGPGPIPMANLVYAQINVGNANYLPLATGERKVDREPKTNPASLQLIANSIASTAVSTRAAVFDALKSFGFDAGANDPMTNFAANVNLSYPAAPMTGAPWQGAE